MAETTGIEWCDSTFNPWIGCEKVSPGCAHCYAETLVTGRMGRAGTWGADGVRQRTSVANWRKPLQWERAHLEFYSEYGHRRRVFCASLADVFEPRPELEPWRRDLFKLIEQTPSLDWLILTKRPDVAFKWLRRFYENYWYAVDHNDPYEPRPWTSRDGSAIGVLPNIWIGTSIENARHTYRADELREIPAAVRFISAEPLLGSLFPLLDCDCRANDWVEGDNNAIRCARCGGYTGEPGTSIRVVPVSPPQLRNENRKPLDLTGIDWLIVGGESGPNARPMNPTWARELRDACEEAEVAFFFKQWGGRYAKAGGKTLDGREWCEMPRQAVPA